MTEDKGNLEALAQENARLHAENEAMKALLKDFAEMPYDSSQEYLIKRTWELLGISYSDEE